MVKPLVWGIIGGVIGVSFLILVAFYYETESDDARLADLRATYFDDVDRLAVAVVLTNADGEFTKANGHLELTIKRGASTVYSNEYDFTKNDFLTWDNLFTGKTKGVMFDIRERFPRGDYDVYANMETKSGYWEGLHATFYSLESEPIQQQVPAPESESIQQHVPAPDFEDVTEMIVESENNCDSSYPDVCIPSPPPDLDCKDVPYSKFKVLPPDPHRFDGDKDGIGCASN